MKEQWQHSELNLFIEQHKQDQYFDAKSVHLTNPEFKKKLDDILAKNVWKGITDGVADSTIHATLPKDPKDIYKNIEDEWHPYVSRTLTFLLSDPERPIGYYSSTWLCRGKVRCSAESFMISFEFNIYFPSDFDMSKILYLLKSQAFTTMPPELSYEEYRDSDGEGIYILKFTKGTGSGGGLLNYGNIAEYDVYNEVIKNLDIIYALNTFEIDYNRQESFDRLCQALVIAYGSD